MIGFHSNLFSAGLIRLSIAISFVVAALVSTTVQAAVPGVTGPGFNLTASADYIAVADGGSIYMWGYSTDGSMQLPGPTLIVTEGDTVTVNLTNKLPYAAGNTSIVFPGHDVTATGGVQGSITQEAANGGTVTYSFIADKPGTYQYHSASQSDVQVEMGLYGALIVRPATIPTGCAHAAYNHPDTCYDREYMYLLSEIDYDLHRAVELQSTGPGPIKLPLGTYTSEYWLMNGRAAPDTMAAAGTAVLPHQPYHALTRMHPGEKILMRVIGAGREMHPFHHHGNDSRIIARDGNLLVSATDPTKLAGPKVFTIPSIPGGTSDAIFEWTGKELGWDMYGHVAGDGTQCIDNDGDGYADTGVTGNTEHEWCADHQVPIPVTLPSLSSLAFGGFYSGSPFLGNLGSLPPGEGGLNPDAGFSYMWHSHTEREMVNNDVFPGGMMTMLIIEAPWVTINE